MFVQIRCGTHRSPSTFGQFPDNLTTPEQIRKERMMRRADLRCLFAFLPLLLFGSAQASAQQGNLLVRVTDAETGNALSDVNVEIFAGGAETAIGGVTDARGLFRISLDPGAYRVILSRLGYEVVRQDRVGIVSGESTPLEVALVSQAFELDPFVVTASRRQEKALEAPASVFIVSRERVQERAALTPIEHIKSEPGVDVVQTGLNQSNVVARGFNNVFSGALLTITDNRYAFVPSLRVNAYNFIPTTDLDFERMEIVLGPGAALYGPNSAQGVFHMVTASPIDRPGSQITVAGGTRSVFQGAFRTAWRNESENFGVKLSGKYFRGNDWAYVDPVEERERQDAINAGADPDTLKIGARSEDAENYSGEIRLDYRPSDDSEWVVQGGINNAASSIELTGIGAGQGVDWQYSYLQSWFSKGRFFAQAFMNASNSGDTYLLRTGEGIVDRSKMYAGQIQHGWAFGDRQDFTYGIDLQRTSPDTEGTINGRNEDDDQIDEAGAYIHSLTNLTDNISLTLALRSDYHSELEDLTWSPRAALQWSPQQDQNFRVTFNRAFSTPTTNNLFLDLKASSIPLGGGLGYDVRTLGVPRSGFNWTPGCAGMGALGDFCMQSPFAPGQALPANAVLAWDALVAAFVPEPLRPLLPNPGTAVQSILRRLDPEAESIAQAFPVDDVFLTDDGRDIARMRPTIFNTFEVGYGGILAGKLRVDANVYTTRIEDFIGPLRVETPSVFLDPTTTAAYVTQQLGPLVSGGQLTPQELQAIITGLASVPVGTIAPDESPSSDILLAYRNFGAVDFWGGDLGAQFLVNERLSVRGSYAYVSKDCFEFGDPELNDGTCSRPDDIALNAPQHKFSLAGRWDDRRRGWGTELRMRWVDSFPMNSGVYIGQVDSYSVFDLNVDVQVPNVPGASVGLTGTNIFNHEHFQFIGAPEIGALWLVRVGYAF